MKNLFIFTSVLIYCSCTSTNKEEITPVKAAPKTEETVTIALFSKDVKPILDFYSCIACHSQATAGQQGGGIELEPHENLLVLVKNGSFYGSMEHTGNWSKMPKGGEKISAEKLKIIKTWIDNGAKND